MNTPATGFESIGHGRWLIPIGLLVVLFWVLAPRTPPPDLRIAVAANFRPAAERLATAFEEDTGLTTELVIGSTGKHHAQIRQGAPFQVFLAADSLRPWLLERDDRAQPGSRWTYALGRLAAWAPGPSAEVAVRSGRVALANPRLAPYGVAADSVLARLGAGEQRILGENVAQALQFAVAGGADVALAALSQVRNRPDGDIWVIPDTLYAPIVQQGVLLVNSDAARRFKSFLGGPAARRIILDAGYNVPGGGHE